MKFSFFGMRGSEKAGRQPLLADAHVASYETMRNSVAS